MKIDLHCHSIYSEDSYLEPGTLIEQALRLGLDGVCFTEHYSLSASNPVRDITPPAGFMVFQGVEISTKFGHLLAYGLEDDSWNRWGENHYLDPDKVMEMVHRMGGICIAAHPFRGDDSFGDRIFDIQGLDAVETHNGRNLDDENREAMRAAELINLPSVGGSDCHKREQIGRAYTVFHNQINSMEQLIREIKAGNCHGRSF